MLLTGNEMYKLKDKVTYDFESNKWLIPQFYLKNKVVEFPMLGIERNTNLVKEEKSKRNIVFKDTGEVLGSDDNESRMSQSHRGMTG